MKLGYLGPQGSFSHCACLSYSHEAKLVPFSTFFEIIEQVESGGLTWGILPLENSTEGAVTSVMDALFDAQASYIQQEILLKVEHNLLGTAKHLESMEYVLSHPQAIQQCQKFLREKLPGVRLIPCESSSQGCIIAKEKGDAYGAIASSFAAEIHGLTTLQRAIQDSPYNLTRFVVIGRDKQMPTGNDKTSIAFSFHSDWPGSLYQVLKEFAERQINLTRIESRPEKTELGKYIFFIDLSGHQDDPIVQEALAATKDQSNRWRVFGSYKAATKPLES